MRNIATLREQYNQLSFKTEKGAAVHHGGNFNLRDVSFCRNIRKKNVIKYRQILCNLHASGFSEPVCMVVRSVQTKTDPKG